MTVTVQIRYVIDPFQRDAFVPAARRGLDQLAVEATSVAK
jgi:hypothetical protein